MKQLRALLLLALTLSSWVGYGQQTGSTMVFPSSGRQATEAWVQEYIFDQLERYVKADCDLTVSNIAKDGNAFEFSVAVSLPSVTQYTVKIQKGEQKWFWYNVPGPRIRIQNVPALDSLRVTIRPTQFPTCYVSFRLDGTVDPDPDPDPDPETPNPTPCPAQPAIPVITNITPTGLTAAVSATSISKINWYISTAAQPNVYLRSGNRAFATTMTLAWADPLPAGDYVYKMEAVNCTAVTTKTFTVVGSGPPLPACKAGPTILSVTNPSTTGLTTQFHGDNVTDIKYYVKQGTTTVRSGDIKPTSSILNITFSSAIAAGNYTLRLEGANCTGFSEFPFTVVGGGGGPPPVGNIVAKYVVTGLPEHMGIKVNGTGLTKTLTDTATVTPPSGYTFRYYINGQQVTQATRLINFPWPSDVPVMIYKMQLKVGYTGDAFNWGYDEGWKDPTIGTPFSQNTSVAFTQIIFDDAASGYNPSTQRVQWMDYLPDAPATDDKVWYAPIGPINTPDQLIAKGVTNFSNYDISALPSAKQTELINAGRTYDEAPKTNTQLLLPDRGAGQWVPPGQSWPNVWNTQYFDYTAGQTEPLTVTQGAEKGNQYSVAHRVIIFENSENNHAVSSHWAFWAPYYQNLAARAQARFPGRWRIAHNYFTGAVGRYGDGDSRIASYGQSPLALEFNTRAQAHSFLDAPISQWPGSPMLPGGTTSAINTACYGLYFGSPDRTNEHPYRMIYAADRTHAANIYLMAFMQEFYEWFPNNYIEVRYPTGKFYLQSKMAHSMAQLYNIAVTSRVFCDGFIPFGATAKNSAQFNFPREFNQGLWFPNGATSPQNPDSFPYWSTSGSPQAWPTDGFEDGIARGMYAYSQTFMQTSGGTKQSLRFRVNGGAWIEPGTNYVHDVVDAYYDKRGFVVAEIKAGKMAVMYMDGFADGSVKTVEYQYNGTTYSLQAASIQAVLKLHTL